MQVCSAEQNEEREQLKALREDYKARKEEDRQNSLAKCQRLLSAGKDALSTIYMQDTPQGLLDDLGVIRVKEGAISDEELGMYLDKYAANWPAYTAVLQLAHSMGRLASVQAPDYAHSLASIGDGVNKYYQQEGPAESPVRYSVFAYIYGKPSSSICMDCSCTRVYSTSSKPSTAFLP